LPITREGNRYIVVAMDYFSRWPEARPLKAANAEAVATFIYEEIICRFGVSRILQSDRGTHFVNEVIRKLTKRFRVRHTLQKPHKLQRCRIDIESISLRRRILIVMRSMSYRYLIDVVSMSIRHR